LRPPGGLGEREGKVGRIQRDAGIYATVDFRSGRQRKGEEGYDGSICEERNMKKEKKLHTTKLDEVCPE